MKKALLLSLTLILAINLSFAKDITQITEEDNPKYIISVTHGGEFIGDIKVEMFPEVAPKHVHNFDSLVSIQFYDGTAFHRVIPDFMIQGGDPNSKNKSEDTWGYGDPSQTKVPAEFSSLSHTRGILSAARSQDINSATSQFFICIGNPTYLDGQYSIYGEVYEGMDVADIIVNVPRDLTTNRPYQKVEMAITKIEPTNIDATEFRNPEILIYPNPVNEVIGFTSASNNMKIKSLEITDINGESILNNTYPNDIELKQIQVPVNNIANGIYLIRLTDVANEVHILKIVVN